MGWKTVTLNDSLFKMNNNDKGHFVRSGKNVHCNLQNAETL